MKRIARELARIADALERRGRVTVWDQVAARRQDRRVHAALIDGNEPAARIEVVRDDRGHLWCRITGAEGGCLVDDLRSALSIAVLSEGTATAASGGDRG